MIDEYDEYDTLDSDRLCGIHYQDGYEAGYEQGWIDAKKAMEAAL